MDPLVNNLNGRPMETEQPLAHDLPKRGSSQKSKAEPPKAIYLRNIKDLTIHGGIDSFGRVVVLPVFSGLGIKGITAAQYTKQAESFWGKNGKLAALLPEIRLFVEQPASFRVRYPVLISGLPLPSAAVIDHMLTDGDTPVAWQNLARGQLARCAKNPRWRTHKMWGQVLTQGRRDVEVLLGLEILAPGLLTEPFRKILEVVQSLHEAVDQAENNRAFALAGIDELNQALKLATEYRLGQQFSFPKQSWSAFYQHLREANLLVQQGLTEVGHRLNVGSTKELHEYWTKQSSWCLLPDIGGAQLLNMAASLCEAQSLGAVWPEGVSMEADTVSRWGYSDQGAIAIAKPRSYQMIQSISMIWRSLVDRALANRLYHNVHLDLPDFARVWSKRFSGESVMAVLSEQVMTRPISEGSAILVRSVSVAQGGTKDGSVRIDPGVIKPEVAALRTISQRKIPVLARYQRLNQMFETAPDPASTISYFHGDEAHQLQWPHGRLWQTVDMAFAMISKPELFLSPEVLSRGYLQLSTEDWDRFNLAVGTEVDIQSSASAWSQTYDWFLGVSPWPVQAMVTKKPAPYASNYWDPRTIAVIDGGLAVDDVRIKVQFVEAGKAEAKSNVISILNFLKDRSRIAPSEDLSSSDNVSILLAEFGNDLRFEARAYFEIDGHEVDEADWFGAQKSKDGYYRLPNGFVVEAAVYLAKTDLFILRKRVYAKFQNVRLVDIWSVHRAAITATDPQIAPEDYIQQLGIRIAPILTDLDSAAIAPLADRLLKDHVADLEPILRGYQAHGVAWSYIRFHLGLGVCLADEMGLGKTLQAIALLRIMKSSDLPSLVVMPKSLLFNWRRELARFAPGLRFAVQSEAPVEDADICLMTYPRLRLDFDKIKKREWNLVVLDEAQAIKNSDAQVTEAANQIICRHRLVLTGTPIENRASELWSLIHWLNPGYLGAQGDFHKYTTLARSSEQKLLLLAPLRECLDPVVLRRRKSDPEVALGLPDKIFSDQIYELSEEQTQLYELVVETVLSEDTSEIKAFARRSMFLKAILHLKQICIHPDLFYGEQDEADILAEIDGPSAAATGKIRALVLNRMRKRFKATGFAGWLARSSKLSALSELVESLRGQSSGILIFTQYLGAADMIRRALSFGRHETIPFIHGGLGAETRLAMVDEFNENCRLRGAGESCPILILSLKAGGVGLNLTGADRVIHFDRWWNPAVEDQATDRTHRMGQERTVFVHTLTGLSSIEQSIQRIFAEKRSLSEDLLGIATASDASELLKDQDGFISLVDPDRTFSRRLLLPH